MSTEDVDKVMHAGLGHRYAFLGPLETARLNADGKRLPLFTHIIQLVVGCYACKCIRLGVQ